MMKNKGSGSVGTRFDNINLKKEQSGNLLDGKVNDQVQKLLHQLIPIGNKVDNYELAIISCVLMKIDSLLTQSHNIKAQLDFIPTPPTPINTTLADKFPKSSSNLSLSDSRMPVYTNQRVLKTLPHHFSPPKLFHLIFQKLHH
jgi:hypothetical protein